MALPETSLVPYIKPTLLILGCLFLSAPAWSSPDQSLGEIEKLIRMRDYAQAVNHLQPLATAGSPEAQYRLASLYRAGKGVDQDLDKASELFHQSAMVGYADSQYALGQLVEKADSSPASLDEAVEWYRKAAAQGHVLAALKLEQIEAALAARNNVTSAEIFRAIARNDVFFINSLIAAGTNLDLTDQHGNTTFMAALLAGWPHLADILLQQTKRVAQPNFLGFSPIHVAAIRGYEKIVIVLLKEGVDIDQTDMRGDTALILAVKSKQTDMLKLLLDRGANIDLRDRHNQSAVDIANAADYPQGIAVLAGIDPASTGTASAVVDEVEQFEAAVEQHGARYAGWPLLNIAIELGDTSLAQQILEQGPDPGAIDPEGNRAIHVAARKGDVDTLGRLLSSGANINAVNNRGQTALYLAVESRSLKCVNLLLTNKADPSIATKPGATPLEVAVRNGQEKIVQRLLKTGSSYAGVHRVLLLAIQEGSDDLASSLIKRDSKLAALDEKGRSALWHSADRGLEKTTALLVDFKKINVNQRDIQGHSALAQAVIKGHTKIVSMLVERGADLTTRTEEGNTLLMLSVLSKETAIAEVLLMKAVDVNAQNKLGDTALMLAAARGQMRMVEKLIEAGADLKLRNKDELNAFQIANNSGHQDIADLIRERSNFMFKLFN